MDKNLLGDLFVKTLSKYNFKNYGKKLFYLELPDSFIILEQLNYMGAAELYLKLIIKECHPEVTNITKNILKDEMLIDTFSWNKLYHNSFNSFNGYGFDFYEIDQFDFLNQIDIIYNKYIEPFEHGVINGIKNFNNIKAKMKYDLPMTLYKDAAIKIGYLEVAAKRDHNWIKSAPVILGKYNVDYRFINCYTAEFILENIVKKAPEGIKGKELSKWINQKCKDTFLYKGYKRDFGYDILILPFIDGKPLKFAGRDGKFEKYINEETNELYRCSKEDNCDFLDFQYVLEKVE